MIGKLVRSSAKADNAIKKAKRASNLATGLNTARFMYTSAGYEAGVEARQMMKEARGKTLKDTTKRLMVEILIQKSEKNLKII